MARAKKEITQDEIIQEKIIEKKWNPCKCWTKRERCTNCN